MEATTIDQLFPTVLEEIFSHLSASDVKNCALVCKAWDEAIGSSEATMKKFELCLNGLDEWGENPELKKKLQESCSTRKHQNLHVQFISYRPALPPSQLFEHFDLSQVKQLRFRASATFNETIKSNIVPTLLSRVPLLEDLNIMLYKANFDDADLPIVTLAKLRKLRVHQHSTSGSFFKVIKASKIIDLTYSEGRFDQLSNEKIAAAAAFIIGQKHLTKLSTSSNLLKQLFERHDFSEMCLESLRLYPDINDNYSDIVQENLTKLLLSNANSLTSLKIPGGIISKEVFVAIFSSLPKLTTLEVEGDINIVSGGSWMENLSPKRLLKHLGVIQIVMNDGLKKILQLSPHIETLKLDGATDSVLSEVATSNRRLVKLEIWALKESIKGDMKFNELKSLKLHLINKVECLASLLVRCPKIETFELLDFCFSDNEVNNIVDILLQQNTLKHLRLSQWSQALCSTVFDRLKVNYGALRSMTFSNMRGDTIQFDFPEDLAEWNVEEQEARFASHWDT